MQPAVFYREIVAKPTLTYACYGCRSAGRWRPGINPTPSSRRRGPDLDLTPEALPPFIQSSLCSEASRRGMGHPETVLGASVRSFFSFSSLPTPPTFFIFY